MAFFLHESLKALTIPAPNPQMEAAAFSSACCPQGPGLGENVPGQCSTGSLKLLKLFMWQGIENISHQWKLNFVNSK